jgi:hypothetical protein
LEVRVVYLPTVIRKVCDGLDDSSNTVEIEDDGPEEGSVQNGSYEDEGEEKFGDDSLCDPHLAVC